MAYPSIPQRLVESVDRYHNSRAQIWKAGDRWESISAEEMLRRVAGLSHALGELGVVEGDRVGVFAPNCPEWAVADYAIQGLGAVTVPVYFNEAPDRMVYILGHAGAKVVVVSGSEQAGRLFAGRGHLDHLEHVIVAGAAPDVSLHEALRFEALVTNVPDEAIALYRQRAAAITEDQLATIIYTSGTTGEPKGVMLTHGNFSSNAVDSLSYLDIRDGDVALEFLPLSHVYERIMGYGYMLRGVSIAYVERMELTPQALLEVHPTVFATVPRFFETLYANMMEKGKAERGFKRKVFEWAVRVAEKAEPWKAYGRPVSAAVKAEWLVADKLVYSKIRKGVGGRARSISSGGAPLSRDLAEFFWAVGLEIYQGYGLTETSPVVSTNYPGCNKVGTVGKPISHVEVRIAEDGEIIVRGPNVMRGYYMKPVETSEVLSPDGWLRTGDLGQLDSDGFLIVTDRKKDLLKTAGGKFVAPQPIENLLKTSPYILNAAVLGDRRKFICALIVPNFPAVEARGREQGIAFASPSEIAAHPWVRELLSDEIARLTANLAQYETIKRFAVLDRDFTFDNGALTYTLKLKRRVIEQQYADAIEQLYADFEEPRPASHP